ncbi:MAG: homoserine kinase, partial [Clostridiales bacterium]
MMFSLRVPATTANIGPGFDTFGMALNFYNYMTIGEAESLCLDIQGEGSGSLAGGKNNLFVRAAQMVYDEVGAGNVAMSVSMINNIPLARGMGSSAATIIGGMVAANHILNNPLPQEEILQLATALEGHPDNVAPALLGGFVCVCQDGGKLHTLNFPPPQALKAIVVVPQVRLSTEKARSAMPKNVSLKDAVFNVSHAAFLALALQKGDIDTFGFMLQDRLHQQY